MKTLTVDKSAEIKDALLELSNEALRLTTEISSDIERLKDVKYEMKVLGKELKQSQKRRG